MAKLNDKSIFLSPAVGNCPLDQMAARVVEELGKRNWNVPGVEVEFGTYGTDNLKYKSVKIVQGKDFKLEFGRFTPEGCPNMFAILSVYIPKQGIHILGHGLHWIPIYYLYVGTDWEKDKDWFMNSVKGKAKKNNEPQVYRKYMPKSIFLTACADEGDEPLSIFLTACTDEGDEPLINLAKKYTEFVSWLEENVLQYILTFPEASASERRRSLIRIHKWRSFVISKVFKRKCRNM